MCRYIHSAETTRSLHPGYHNPVRSRKPFRGLGPRPRFHHSYFSPLNAPRLSTPHRACTFPRETRGCVKSRFRTTPLRSPAPPPRAFGFVRAPRLTWFHSPVDPICPTTRRPRRRRSSLLQDHLRHLRGHRWRPWGHRWRRHRLFDERHRGTRGTRGTNGSARRRASRRRGAASAAACRHFWSSVSTSRMCLSATRFASTVKKRFGTTPWPGNG